MTMPTEIQSLSQLRDWLGDMQCVLDRVTRLARRLEIVSDSTLPPAIADATERMIDHCRRHRIELREALSEYFSSMGSAYDADARDPVRYAAAVIALAVLDHNPEEAPDAKQD